MDHKYLKYKTKYLNQLLYNNKNDKQKGGVVNIIQNKYFYFNDKNILITLDDIGYISVDDNDNNNIIVKDNNWNIHNRYNINVNEPNEDKDKDIDSGKTIYNITINNKKYDIYSTDSIYCDNFWYNNCYLELAQDIKINYDALTLQERQHLKIWPLIKKLVEKIEKCVHNYINSISNDFVVFPGFMVKRDVVWKETL